MGLILSLVICIATSKECQLIRNGENLTDFQQSQATQTVYEANIFSSIQETGVEMVKKEEQGRCPTEYRLPPILIHFLEILALALLNFHTVFHGHAIFIYLKKALLKRRQEQAEAALAKVEAEQLKMKAEVDKQVAARLKKEKVEDRFNSDISLSSA